MIRQIYVILGCIKCNRNRTKVNDLNSIQLFHTLKLCNLGGITYLYYLSYQIDNIRTLLIIPKHDKNVRWYVFSEILVNIKIVFTLDIWRSLLKITATRLFCHCQRTKENTTQPLKEHFWTTKESSNLQ